MKNINDTPIYTYFSIVMLIVAVLLTGTGLYSRLYVEKKAQTLLSVEGEVDTPFRDAYLLLRSPQVFAGYEHFDADGISVRNTLVYFDAKMTRGEPFVPEEGAYIRLLLDRRQKGSRLTLSSAIFCYIVSLLGAVFFFHEKKKTVET